MNNPTQKQSETLKPCPFCGGEAIRCGANEYNPSHWVMCKKCHACPKGELPTLEEAIDAWNTRAQPSETPVADKVRQLLGRIRWGGYWIKPMQWEKATRTDMIHIAKEALALIDQQAAPDMCKEADKIAQITRAWVMKEKDDAWNRDFSRPYIEWYVLSWRVHSQRQEIARLHKDMKIRKGKRIADLAEKVEGMKYKDIRPYQKHPWDHVGQKATNATCDAVLAEIEKMMKSEGCDECRPIN